MPTKNDVSPDAIPAADTNATGPVILRPMSLISLSDVLCCRVAPPTDAGEVRVDGPPARDTAHPHALADGKLQV